VFPVQKLSAEMNVQLVGCPEVFGRQQAHRLGRRTRQACSKGLECRDLCLVLAIIAVHKGILQKL